MQKENEVREPPAYYDKGFTLAIIQAKPLPVLYVWRSLTQHEAEHIIQEAQGVNGGSQWQW